MHFPYFLKIKYQVNSKSVWLLLHHDESLVCDDMKVSDLFALVQWCSDLWNRRRWGLEAWGMEGWRDGGVMDGGIEGWRQDSNETWTCPSDGWIYQTPSISMDVEAYPLYDVKFGCSCYRLKKKLTLATRAQSWNKHKHFLYKKTNILFPIL